MNELHTVKGTKETLIDQMQDFHYALAMIEQLKGGTAVRRPYDNLRPIIDALLREMPYMGYEHEAPFTLFRGRIANDRETLSKPSEFSFCPVEYSNSYGRCHKPKNTIFYGGTNIDTVLSELTPEVGDTVHIGIASVKSGQKATFTAIGEIDHCRRYKRPLIGNHETYELLNSILLGMSPETRTRTLLVDAFFSEFFSKPASKQRDYKLTSALADLLLETGTEEREQILDGFAYPSVAHRGGMNYVVKPDSFDGLFGWNKFIACKINNYLGFGLYDYHVYAEAVFESEDDIQWSFINKG